MKQVKINLSFSTDMEKDIAMVIEEFIHHFGSQYKEEIILMAVKDVGAQKKLEALLLKENDPNTKLTLRQKHTNLNYDIQVFIKAIRTVYKIPDITEQKIRESLERQVD